jgi:hypothetical protein
MGSCRVLGPRRRLGGWMQRLDDDDAIADLRKLREAMVSIDLYAASVQELIAATE